jgi:hypothetical protein
MRILVVGLLSILLAFINGKAYGNSPVIITNLNEINNLAGSYALGEDIDGASHNILGNFSGQLDGRGFKIINLTSPVFSELMDGVVITNLVLKDVDITGSFLDDVGTLSNRASGIIHISNMEISGAVTGTGITGGLIGAYRYSSTVGLPENTTFISLNSMNLVDLEVSGSNSSGSLFGIVDISVNKQAGNTCSNCNQTNNTDSINDSNITGIKIVGSEFRNLVVSAASQGSAGGIIGDFRLRNDTEAFAQSNYSFLGGDIQTTASVTNNGRSINNGHTLGFDLSDSIFDNITVNNLGLNTESNYSGGLMGSLFVGSSAKSNSKVFAFTASGDASYIGSGQVLNSSLASAINAGDISAINLSDVDLEDFTVISSSAFAGLIIGDLSIEKTVESEALIQLNGSTANSSGIVVNEANSTNSGSLRAINSMNLNSFRNQVVSPENLIDQNIGKVVVNQGTTTRASTDLYRNSVLFNIAGSNSGISANLIVNQGSVYLNNISNSSPPAAAPTPTYVRKASNLSFAQSLYGSDTLSDPDGQLRVTVDKILNEHGSLIK